MSDDDDDGDGWVFVPAKLEPLTQAQENKLKDLYYKRGYQRGILSTYKEVNSDGVGKPISRRQVERWLKKQEAYQIDLQPNKTYHIKPIVTSKAFELLQVDFIDFVNEPSKGYKYILVVIDVFSKKVWFRFQKNKTMSTTTEAMRDIITDWLMGHDLPNDGVVEKIQSDNEFKGSFTKLLRDNNIIHIRNRGFLPQSNGVVERVIQTLKRLLARRQQNLQAKNKGSAWANLFQGVVDDYNESYHSTLKTSPNDVFYNYEDKDFLKKIKSNSLKPKLKVARERAKTIPAKLKKPLEIGDTVRTVRRKGTLAKYGTDNWSGDVYKVTKIINDPNNLRTTRYKTTELKDGKHYQYAREELQRVGADIDLIPSV